MPGHPPSIDWFKRGLVWRVGIPQPKLTRKLGVVLPGYPVDIIFGRLKKALDDDDLEETVKILKEAVDDDEEDEGQK